MSVVSDLVRVVERDFERIERDLVSIERAIRIAGSAVDSWTRDQANSLRFAMTKLLESMRDIRSLAQSGDEQNAYARLREEMLTIDDLRRAVDTFEKFVAKWVNAPRA